MTLTKVLTDLTDWEQVQPTAVSPAPTTVTIDWAASVAHSEPRCRVRNGLSSRLGSPHDPARPATGEPKAREPLNLLTTTLDEFALDRAHNLAQNLTDLAAAHLQ